MKSLLFPLIGATVLVLVPLVAMQFTVEVDWSLSDFVIAWLLLFSAGVGYMLLARASSSLLWRAAVALTVGTSLFLVWANLAVGLIGSENNPFNLWYMLLVAVVFLGSIFSRLRPQAMARVLFAAAGLQLLITIMALLSGQQHIPESSVVEILAVNGFFVMLWVGAGGLFQLRIKN